MRNKLVFKDIPDARSLGGKQNINRATETRCYQGTTVGTAPPQAAASVKDEQG